MDYLMTKLYHSLKMNMVLQYNLYKVFNEFFKTNARQMILCCLLKFSFARNFHDKIMRCIQTYSFWHFEIRLRYKTKQSVFPHKNNSVTIVLNFLLHSISAIISSNNINPIFSLLDYNLLNFHKHHQLIANNQ